ncbi:MAG: glycoside hydrolase family 3 N-terminal domain-containing protein [Bacteroidota bacterium]
MRLLLWLVLALPLLVVWPEDTGGSRDVVSQDPWPGTGAWADAVLDTLSLDAKVGQLILTDAHGRPDHLSGGHFRRLTSRVEDYGVGGLLFFRGNANDQAELTRRLQQRAAIPLLIAQDMETGAGMRTSGTTRFPNAMALGATGDPALAYAMGRGIAAESRVLGIHQNYAPVADLNTNPRNPIINVRAFGADPRAASRMVIGYAQGLQDGGVVATLKHFPGHGDTQVDSHADLPVLPFRRERLDATEWMPFREGVAAGVMSVMTGHLALPALDDRPNTPATLSKPITTGVLREELGFEGLIVTDGMNMEGVAKHYAPGEAAVRAVEAGADQLILTRDERAVKRALLAAVRSGRLAEDRIDVSVRRILRMKEWLGLHQPAPPTNTEPAEEAFPIPVTGTPTDAEGYPWGTRALLQRTPPRPDVDALAAPSTSLLARNARLARTIVQRALTLTRNEGDVLPLRTDQRVLVVSVSDGSRASVGRPLANRLSVVLDGEATYRFARRGASDADHAALARLAAEHDVVVLSTHLQVRNYSGRIGLPSRHQALVNRLVGTETPVVLAAFGNPYVLLGVDQPAGFLAAYDTRDYVQEAVADALVGLYPIQGSLPIDIPGLHAVGDGILVAQARLRDGTADDVGMVADSLDAVDLTMQEAVTRRVFPGAALAIGRAGVLVKQESYGRFTYGERFADPVLQRSIETDTVFDLASVTKVAATTVAAMMLVDQGRLNLDAPVAHYIPAFGAGGKDIVTVRQLLAHQGGQRVFHPFHTHGITDPDSVRAFIYADSLRYTPGQGTRYSDFDMIVLGDVIEAIGGLPLDEFLRQAVFEPLGMISTGFRPVGFRDEAVVPTEIDRNFRSRLLQGEVHDETASILGGVAGHAGLFSTAEDLSTLAFMLANGGIAHGRRFFSEATLNTFIERVSPRGAFPMALGWMAYRPPGEGFSSAGQHFGPRSFGHTGFTGCSLWIDPDQELFVVLLTNRTWPSRGRSAINRLRASVADLAAQSVVAAPHAVEWID